MFIQIEEPEFVDLLSTRPSCKIRLREKSAPGRLWLTLNFASKQHLALFLKKASESLAEGVQEWRPSKEEAVKGCRFNHETLRSVSIHVTCPGCGEPLQPKEN